MKEIIRKINERRYSQVPVRDAILAYRKGAISFSELDRVYMARGVEPRYV